MRTIVYCPHCGYVGSIEEGSEVPNCPHCDRLLMDTGYTRDAWRELSPEERQNLKLSWESEKSDQPDLQSESNPLGDLDPDTVPCPPEGVDPSEWYLRQILGKQIKIHSWVRFFGVITVISMIAGFIIGLILARK